MPPGLSLRTRCDLRPALSFQPAPSRWGRTSDSLPADPRLRTFHVFPERRQTSRHTISSFRRPGPCRSECDERPQVAPESYLQLAPLARRPGPTAWLAADSCSRPGCVLPQPWLASLKDLVLLPQCD